MSSSGIASFDGAVGPPRLRARQATLGVSFDKRIILAVIIELSDINVMWMNERDDFKPRMTGPVPPNNLSWRCRFASGPFDWVSAIQPFKRSVRNAVPVVDLSERSRV